MCMRKDLLLRRYCLLLCKHLCLLLHLTWCGEQSRFFVLTSRLLARCPGGAFFLISQPLIGRLRVPRRRLLISQVRVPPLRLLVDRFSIDLCPACSIGRDQVDNDQWRLPFTGHRRGCRLMQIAETAAGWKTKRRRWRRRKKSRKGRLTQEKER